ncbi:MAG: hypothetical protein OXO52_17600 [Rhodospirillales bacterium]|nr:hypothetical protein [Rhodospirillales bacterium]MDE0380144.1 hypothetical protein [Rhodospirillales bacterium]
MIRSGEEYRKSPRDEPVHDVRSHNNRECDWGSVLDYVDELLQSYGPGPMLDKGAAG